MVELVSFILGLTVGVRPVQVAVDATVAAVEIRLDGTAAGTITGPPWYLAVQFGQRLEPRLLEAVAFDADGQELDRARLVVNYGLMNYQAVLVLETARAGRPRPGRVLWDAILDRRPRKIVVTLDGRELRVDDRGRFELPPYDPGEIHFLVAELSFAKDEHARAELDFGGEVGDRLTSALTAVPLLVPAGTELPSPEGMRDWFETDGERLRPFSTPASDLHLVVVRDAALEDEAAAIARELQRQGRLPPEPRLGGDDSLRFVSTLRPGDGAFRAEQPRRSKTRSGVWELIARYRPDEARGGRRERWTTLAAAGRFAADGDRRRAVVALLGRRAPDRSSLTAAQAVGYLESVRVPLFVWAADAAELTVLDGVGANTYSGADGLAELFADLAACLRAQHMVWIEGLHFPARIRLTEQAPPGIRLAE
jgi:hypothetical protein